jgi:hypothetical protein
MRLRVILPLMLAALFALGACGSSGAPPKAAPGSTNTSLGAVPAGALPSVSAKMVCNEEAQVEIGESLGEPATRVTKPTWRDHVYSCTYVYPKGSFVISVKELIDEKSTTAFFESYKKKLGAADNLFGLGDGAFVAKNDDVVVRKDYKVLLVDVKDVPKPLGKFVPAMVRSDVASNVAAVIMSCWIGA